ncbi:MAG: benzoate/H(+) symporter BenE family transporter [Pseudomonadota bacterium]
MRLHKDWSIAAVIAGFVAVLVSYSGPLAIFFQAPQSAEISTAMMTSWVWAISIGAAISGIALSLWLKVPVVTAWSAPGTALLVTLFPDLSLNEAVGAYLTAAAVIFVIGVTGSFDRIIQAIPPGIASAMMAGILFQFGVGVFISLESVPAMTLGMLLTYLVFKRLTPRYSLVALLVVGVGLALILEGASLVSIVTACFGGITTVIAAITAAICTSKEAHEDPGKRYVAGVANGIFYLIGCTFAGTIVLLFTSLPGEFVAVLAGLALIGAITSNFSAFAAHKDHLEASVITFIATASGISFLGLGSAFWGVVVGALAYALLHRQLPGSGRRSDRAKVRKSS